MRQIGILLLCCISLLSSGAQTVPNLYRAVDQEKMNHWVDSVFDAMSYDERIGQLFMVIANPKSDNRNMQRLMRYVNDIKIGGILFHKGDPVTQAEVTNRLQKASRIPMLVSLDGEWGLSMRLSGTTRFPKNMMLGAIEDNALIEEYGKEVGRQCREMGIHINFAPDMDVNSNVDNPVIGLRSFGENPEAVAEMPKSSARRKKPDLPLKRRRLWRRRVLLTQEDWKVRASCLSPNISPDMEILPRTRTRHYPLCAITGPAWIAWNFFLLNVIYMMGSPG